MMNSRDQLIYRLYLPCGLLGNPFFLASPVGDVNLGPRTSLFRGDFSPLPVFRIHAYSLAKCFDQDFCTYSCLILSPRCSWGSLLLTRRVCPRPNVPRFLDSRLTLSKFRDGKKIGDQKPFGFDGVLSGVNRLQLRSFLEFILTPNQVTVAELLQNRTASGAVDELPHATSPQSPAASCQLA